MTQSLVADVLAFLDSLTQSPDLRLRAKAIELAARLRRNDSFSETLGFKTTGNC